MALELSQYLARDPHNADCLLFLDPVTGKPLDMTGEQPYSRMRASEKLTRGREFWRRAGSAVDLLIVAGNHSRAADLGPKRQFERLMRNRPLYGFENFGGSDRLLDVVNAMPHRERRQLSGFAQRSARAARKAGAVAFTYDVPRPHVEDPDYSLLNEINYAFKADMVDPSKPAPPGVTPQERVGWVAVGGVMRMFYIRDSLGAKLDETTQGAYDTPSMITIGSGHHDFMVSELEAYSVRPQSVTLDRPPSDGILRTILTSAETTGMVSVDAVMVLASIYADEPMTLHAPPV